MEPINFISSVAVPICMENIDTDQIIPARFLKATTREGFGDNLFRDWRYLEDGNLNMDCTLNNYDPSAKILVVGKNFGCGSSREHAAWALYDYGFRVIISTHFADIFKTNALNNGILPVEIIPPYLEYIFRRLDESPQTAIDINLKEETGHINDIIFHFSINAYKKNCLLNGYNDLTYLMTLRSKIEDFEKNHIY